MKWILRNYTTIEMNLEGMIYVNSPFIKMILTVLLQISCNYDLV